MIASSLLCPPNNITDVIYNLETLATRGPLIVRQPVTVDTYSLTSKRGIVL